MRCGESSRVKFDEEGFHAVTQHCRCWQCDICLPRRQAQLTAKAAAGRPNLFLTLTVNPAIGRDPTHRAQMLVEAWRIIRERARKRWKGEKLPFLRVFEATKRGEPHLHILCRGKFLPQKWISAQAAQLLGAPIVHIEAIRKTKALASYVAKYVGKEPHKFGTSKRYYATRSYEVDPYEKPEPMLRIDGNWYADDRSLKDLEHGLRMEFWQTALQGRELWAWKHDPPW